MKSWCLGYAGEGKRTKIPPDMGSFRQDHNRQWCNINVPAESGDQSVMELLVITHPKNIIDVSYETKIKLQPMYNVTGRS